MGWGPQERGEELRDENLNWKESRRACWSTVLAKESFIRNKKTKKREF
jgi:hypothetical protein